MSAKAPHNPFATRWIRPGAIAYRFAEGASAGQLVDRLRAACWHGEIIGPHGSGKSTLLASLLPALEAAGRRVAHVVLHDGARRLPAELRSTADWSERTQLVVDGYEQLSHFSRWRLRRRARRVGAGLLVTAHRTMGFLRLIEVQASAAVLENLVAELQSDCPALISAADVRASFSQHSGDACETLFDLYDLYERRMRHNRAPQQVGS